MGWTIGADGITIKFDPSVPGGAYLPPATVDPGGITGGGSNPMTPLPEVTPAPSTPPTGGINPPGEATVTASADPCVVCGITNIGACLACFINAVETRLLILLFILLGVYLLFRPEANKAITYAFKKAK